MPRSNPGVRVEPDFANAKEQEQLASECQECARLYGYNYEGDTSLFSLGSDGVVEKSMELVNNVRVTGRLERPDLPQRLPPWGYGATFQDESLPPYIRQLAARVQKLALLGPLRDVTVNGRDDYFFKLDPHVDPHADGPDVFILSLLSTVVLTFTPGLEARIAGQP